MVALDKSIVLIPLLPWMVICVISSSWSAKVRTRLATPWGISALVFALKLLLSPGLYDAESSIDSQPTTGLFLQQHKSSLHGSIHLKTQAGQGRTQ